MKDRMMLKATVSGSFHRHMMPIYEAVGDLRAAGVDVLSPSDPRVVDNIGDFLFVASDKLRSIKLVQDRHLQAIRASDFLWLVCPDGYTGPSASMEIGAAHTAGVPVFSVNPALDSTLGAYVTRVAGVREAISLSAGRVRRREVGMPHLLLEPTIAARAIHAAVDRTHSQLIGRSGSSGRDAEGRVTQLMETLKPALNGLA